MKTTIITLMSIMLLGIAAVVGGALLFAKSATDDHQGNFMQAVQSGNPAEVLSLLDDELLDSVDEPILLAWMQAVNKHLGEYQGISGTSFSTSVNFDNEGTRVESKATLNFEKGTAESELVLLDGKIIRFLIESEQLNVEWFNGPADTSLYQKRTRDFFQNFAERKMETAQANMHTALLEEVPVEKLTEMRDAVANMVGDIENIEITTDDFSKDGNQQLVVNAVIKGTTGNLNGNVIFLFDGLQGKMIEFNMSKQK